MNTDIFIEDLPYCPQNKAVGGISTRVWYAPANYFSKIALPAASGFSSSRVIERKGISLYGHKSLSYIDLFINQNSLTEKTSGSIKRWKLSTELKASILELNARNTGFISKVKNEALILLIPDANGRLWVMGNKKNAAYLSNYEGNTGEQYEDDSILNLTFTANTALYLYNADVSDIRAVGGFSGGYNTGFRI
ncbi:hypothetical protein [Riemerella columbipharyngis]|uniref:Uncharacterized protein n=1 Tax=Riemerella columbipharyngis TaxID=1071918 RepID=A0A1G7EWS7_9FLAO|nr:hypothetical protein [Riemerella columbipharyngis]SDE68123.1 hypothetical protein SAMN05421544_1183 [Riemerella columbipharyngis]